MRGEKTRGKTGRGDAVSAGWAPSPGGPTDPGQNYVDDRSRLEKWWMKRLVAPCVRSVRLSKALLLVSVHLSAEASTARAASEGNGDGTRRGGFRSEAAVRGFRPRPHPRRASLRRAGTHPPSRDVPLAKAEQPRHLLTPSRRASFEVAVFGAESFLDRALIASLAFASGRAHPEQVSVAAAKSPPAIHLAAVGNPTRLRTTVLDAQVSRLRHADASLDGARASASVSDAQAAVSRRRRAPLDQASPTAAVCSAKPETRVPLAAPFASASSASSVGDASPAPDVSRASRRARIGAARRVSRSLSSLVVLRAHSASPGAVPARLVRAHANAAVDAAPAVTDRLAAASGSDAEFLLGVAARVVSAQSANRAGALAAGDGARVAAAVGDAKVGGAARALPAALVLASAPAAVGDALPSGARSDGAAGHGAPTPPRGRSTDRRRARREYTPRASTSGRRAWRRRDRGWSGVVLGGRLSDACRRRRERGRARRASGGGVRRPDWRAIRDPERTSARRGGRRARIRSSGRDRGPPRDAGGRRGVRWRRRGRQPRKRGAAEGRGEG